MNRIVSKLRQACSRLRAALGAAAIIGLLATSSPAKADDPVQLEMARTQLKLNELMMQRISNLERRVTLLEQKVQTPYTPGSPPPAPSYSPPASSSTPPPPPLPPLASGTGCSSCTPSSGSTSGPVFGYGPGQIPPGYASYWRSKGWAK